MPLEAFSIDRISSGVAISNNVANIVQNMTQQNLTTLFKVFMNKTDSSSSYNTISALPYWIFIKNLKTMNESSSSIAQPLANTLTSNSTTDQNLHFVLPKISVKGVPTGWKPFPHPSPVWTHHKPQIVSEVIPQAQLGGDTPQEIWNAYGLNSASCSMTGYSWGDPHLCGYGQVVAIIDAYDNPNIQFDLAEFDTQFGLPLCTLANGCLTEFSYGGTPTTPPSNLESWISETDLDVEWVHAIAPGAAIALVEADNQNDLFGAAQASATKLSGVNQVSMSWGFPEYISETSTDLGFQVPGVSFIAAIGDHGDEGTSSLGYPALSPYVVAVGGTVLDFNNGIFQNEIAWSLGYGGHSGEGTSGGLSLYEPEPSYQHNFGISSNNMRGTPDVSASAWNMPIFDSYDTQGGLAACNTDPSNCWGIAAGTSGAAPKWAGIIAIANSKHPSNPLSSTSFGTLDAIYNAAIGRSYGQNYRDITSGQNGNCGICNANSGYDFVTGLGSPLTNNLIPFLSPNPPVLPGPPTGLIAKTISSSQIYLSWVSPVNPESAPIVGYMIERESPIGGGFSVFVTNTGTTSTTYLNTGLTANTQYNYRISSISSVGTGTPSNTAAAITLPQCSSPVSGDWTVTSSCTMTVSSTAPANVIVNNGVVLTIQNGIHLNIDLIHYHLLIKSGGGVLIKTGGAIN